MAQSLCHLNWKFSKDSFVKKKKKVLWDLFLSFSHQPWNHKIIVHFSKPGYYQNHLGNF